MSTVIFFFFLNKRKWNENLYLWHVIIYRKAFEHILAPLISHKNKILKTRLIAVSLARINNLYKLYVRSLPGKILDIYFIIIIYLHF